MVVVQSAEITYTYVSYVSCLGHSLSKSPVMRLFIPALGTNNPPIHASTSLDGSSTRQVNVYGSCYEDNKAYEDVDAPGAPGQQWTFWDDRIKSRVVVAEAPHRAADVRKSDLP